MHLHTELADHEEALRHLRSRFTHLNWRIGRHVAFCGRRLPGGPAGFAKAAPRRCPAVGLIGRGASERRAFDNASGD